MVRLRKHRLNVVLAVTALIALLSACAAPGSESVLAADPPRSRPTPVATEVAPNPVPTMLSGAAGSYEVSGGEPCPSRQVAVAAFVKAGQGYLLQIRSNAPNRCDASKLPKTAPVLDSLRLP